MYIVPGAWWTLVWGVSSPNVPILRSRNLHILPFSSLILKSFSHKDRNGLASWNAGQFFHGEGIAMALFHDDGKSTVLKTYGFLWVFQFRGTMVNNGF